MAQKKYTDGSGVAEIWANTKNYIAAQLLGYSQTGHTHSASDITNGLATVATSGSYNDLSDKPTIPKVNNATLTIQKNGTTVKTFTANASSNVTANITVPTKTSDLNNDSGFITGVSWNDVSGKPSTFTPSSHTHNYAGSSNAGGAASSTLKLETYKRGSTTETYGANYPIFAQWVDGSNVALKCTNYTVCVDKANSVAWNNVSGRPSLATVATSGSYNDLSDKPTIPTALESLSTNSIPFHNSYPRCKYLGTTITDAQNTAIKNRTYDDLFIGDYWTINGVNWRIVAIDYYFNIGDTNFDKGNIIVMPDTVLYNAQMNKTSTTAGAYAGSLMRTQNLNNARTIAQNAFGSHLANHRIMLANSVTNSNLNGWAWCDSDGVELPNEVQIYGTRAWGSALKGFDVATQKQQFPLLALAPQFVNTRQNYWLQDVSSYLGSGTFACVSYGGIANYSNAGDAIGSSSYGVRPAVTLSYI